MDELFDELTMVEVNFDLQQVAEELKEELAALQADQLFLDKHVSYEQSTNS